MRFHYNGRFSGNPDDLPSLGDEPNAVQFKEAEDPKKLSLIANGISLLIAVVTFGIYFVYGRQPMHIIGSILSIVTLVPHEFLHALCFRDDVYMYEYLSKGMLFVVGSERMSKARFIFMSMLPNLVFGFIPFLLFLIHPSWTVLGTLGAFAIPMGAGDYINVFNALTQMPKGAKTYMKGFHSYWYLPEGEN
ncbi:MAG: DUF3267 domain-containing protein [Erysipelotrichaceae bacterium]|nr:DUF3267 domain-containing protein [Erysipelotrichaceae bacterium]